MPLFPLIGLVQKHIYTYWVILTACREPQTRIMLLSLLLMLFFRLVVPTKFRFQLIITYITYNQERSGTIYNHINKDPLPLLPLFMLAVSSRILFLLF